MGRGGSPSVGLITPSVHSVCTTPGLCLPRPINVRASLIPAVRCMAGRLRRRARASTAQVLQDMHQHL